MKNPLTKALRPVVWILALSFIHVQGFAQISGDDGDIALQPEDEIPSMNFKTGIANGQPDHFTRQEAVSLRVNGGDTDADNKIIENKTQNEPMVYKFYKETTKPEASQSNSNKLVDEFKKIYDRNDIEFIGLWINAENPHEQFYMTGFKNKAHYKQFLDEVKSDVEYQEMSDKINMHRESIEVLTLIPAEDQ